MFEFKGMYFLTLPHPEPGRLKRQIIRLTEGQAKQYQQVKDFLHARLEGKRITRKMIEETSAELAQFLRDMQGGRLVAHFDPEALARGHMTVDVVYEPETPVETANAPRKA